MSCSCAKPFRAAPSCFTLDQMAVNRAPDYLRRSRECDVFDRLLADVRAGAGAALVVRGQAAAGKTTLFRYTARQATGFHVAHTAGVETEIDLPFAGVERLCGPFLGRLSGVPEHQRDAVSVALGVSAGDPPDHFLVAIGVLSLLSAVAQERPLLCLVDDAQWLDRSSAQVL